VDILEHPVSSFFKDSVGTPLLNVELTGCSETSARKITPLLNVELTGCSETSAHKSTPLLKMELTGCSETSTHKITPLLKMELTGCSKPSAHKIQMPGGITLKQEYNNVITFLNVQFWRSITMSIPQLTGIILFLF
jgi:flavin-binding protein dodecin